MSSGPFHRFRDWVGHNKVEGLTSEGKAEKYVPHAAQSGYWTLPKIGEILQSRSSIIASTNDLSGYICILSILAYIEADGIQGLDYLHEATRRDRDDATLPWTESEQNGIFGDSSVGRKVLLKFIEVQWMFYPMSAQPFLTAHSAMPSRAFMPNGQAKFMFDRRIDRRQIFPITKRPDSTRDIRRAGRRVTVDYMEVHGSITQVPFTVVFKNYPPEELQNYNDERDGYTAVRNARDTDNILRCLGSFHYKTSDGRQYSTIMSELAEMTLRDVFLGNELPYQLDHFRAVWKSFLGSLYGLATIHNQKHPHGYLCVHQDLKPSNIFVFRPRDKENPFSYQLKIGDFGSSYARSANPAFHNQNGPDRGATRIYGPPETYLNDTFNSNAEATSDMWAIGCIMIELAVWITCGKLGLDEFHDQRIKETECLPELTNLGRSDCFHDGVEVLKCVKQVKNTVPEYCRNHDTFTLEMVKLALEYLLVSKNERLTALQLIPRVQRALAEAVTNDAVFHNSTTNVPVTQSPESASPPALQNPTPMEQPVLSFTGLEAVTSPILNSSNQQEGHSAVNSGMSSLSSLGTSPIDSSPALVRPDRIATMRPSPAVHQEVPKEVPANVTTSAFPFVSINDLEAWANGRAQARVLYGHDSAKSLLGGRDFVFLIDNSRHTKQYKEEMKIWTTSLMKLLKTIDSDGIDVANTSAPHAGKKIKTKTDMAKFMDQTFAREIGVDCIIENALNVILNPIKQRWKSRRSSLITIPGIGQRNKASQGVTVLIFTNGVWNATPEGTCNAELPILSLIDSMRRNDIPRTQVCIQFVRMGSEERGIRRLEFLDDELDKTFDIVDTKPTTSSIWDVVIGPLEAGMDNNVTSSGPATPNHNLRRTT